MANYYYSASNNTFIAAGSSLLNTASFTDALAVDDATFNDFFVGEKDSMRRTTGKDGMPLWVEIPEPTNEEMKALVVVETERKKHELIAEASDKIREWLTDLLLGTINDDDKTRLIAWREYMKSLKLIDAASAYEIMWPARPS